MIDLILGVDDPMLFHRINLQQFPHHYSFLRYAGVPTICRVQRLGAGVYFNVGAQFQGEVNDLSRARRGERGGRGGGDKLIGMNARMTFMIDDQIRSYT
jgi:hypothetical protein